MFRIFLQCETIHGIVSIPTGGTIVDENVGHGLSTIFGTSHRILCSLFRDNERKFHVGVTVSSILR